MRGKAKRQEPQEEPIEAKLPEAPGPKAVAPYTPATELEDSNLRFLIHYCKPHPNLAITVTPRLTELDVTFVTAKTVTNVGPRFEWYPLAVRDEAFFHAVISSTCGHVTYMTGLELPYKWIFFRHRGHAIRLVNERLAHGAHDEGTINAIVVFAQQEVRGTIWNTKFRLTVVSSIEFRSTRPGRQDTYGGSSTNCTGGWWPAVSRIEREDSPTPVLVR
jgi:hypothetical protein